MMLLKFDARRPKALRRRAAEAADRDTPAIVAIAWELHRMDTYVGEWAARFLRGVLDNMKAQQEGGR